MPRRYRYIRVNREIIAKCTQCEELYTWLPDNFDMRHRFNRETHEYCGGEIQPTDTGSVT